MTDKPQKSKNRLEASRKGNVIEIRFVASDEVMAQKVFDLIEAIGLTATRMDLEAEWKGGACEGNAPCPRCGESVPCIDGARVCPECGLEEDPEGDRND